jgi:O-antigen/teichoic acid export membrane protein
MVRNVWHFAVGMSGITLSTLLLHQLDRVILSGVLSLEAFGYYTLGSTVANSLIMIIGAVFNTTFPRLSELVVLGAEENIKRFYHLCSQLMATLIFPAAVMLFFFSYEILLLWTQNARTANTVAPIVSVLVVGTALYGVRYTPYTLQLARGWTHIPLYINVALIPLYLPAVFFVAVRLGAIGAALMWVVLNIVYLAISVALTHRRFLKGYAWRWMLKDVAPPLGTSILVALVGRQVMTSLVSSFVAGLQLLAVYAIALVASVLAVDRTRVWAFTQLAAGFRRLA